MTVVDLSRRNLVRYFAGRVAVTVTGADVARYADLRLKEKAAPATVNRDLAALRRAYRLAVRQGVLPTAPPIVALRENNVRTGFFESDQFEAVCSRLGEIEADVARFCYHTGWRTKSEVFPLTWAQVDRNGATFIYLRLLSQPAERQGGRESSEAGTGDRNFWRRGLVIEAHGGANYVTEVVYPQWDPSTICDAVLGSPTRGGERREW